MRVDGIAVLRFEKEKGELSLTPLAPWRKP